MRKETTALLDRVKGGELVNGGMHRQKAWRKVRAMLDDHGFTSPRLYHLVLVDLVDGPANANRFLKALRALCRELREQGIRYRWRAAIELDEDKDSEFGKGWHFHVFILLENLVANTNGIITTNLNITKPIELRDDKWPARIKQPDGTKGKPVRTLGDIMQRQPLTVHIANPQDRMHWSQTTGKKKSYASIAGDKKADCINWLSYLVKARSKPDLRGIYFSSRDSRKVGSIH